MRAVAELESATDRSVPQRIYGRMLLRPEILCPCLGTGRAVAELE